MRHFTKIMLGAITAVAFVLSTGLAQATVVKFKADLSASAEVPAKDSTGTGTLTASLDTDTNELTYHIEYSGLTGPAVAAHFHGPAAPGVNSKPQVPIRTSPIASPIDGKVTLTAEQVKDLEDGKWYFNLHTSANPGGEIRGQVLKAE